MLDNEEEYVEPGIYRLYSGTGGLVFGAIIAMTFYLGSQYYFANTNISIINKEFARLVIAVIVTFIEVCIINYIKNRKKDLAKFSKSQFDSPQGCGFLIFILLGLVCLNNVLFCEINGRFDPFDSSKRKVKIINKFRRGNSRGPTFVYDYYFVVENWNNNGREAQFQIPESVYNKFGGNSIIEFETKPGLLGFEHLSSDIKESK